MSIYRIFMKLMTQHLVSHLIVPMVLGVTVEILVAWLLAWRHGAMINPREYLISAERIGLYAGIIITYLIIAGWFVQKQGKEPWQKTEMMKLDIFSATLRRYSPLPHIL